MNKPTIWLLFERDMSKKLFTNRHIKPYFNKRIHKSTILRHQTHLNIYKKKTFEIKFKSPCHNKLRLFSVNLITGRLTASLRDKTMRCHCSLARLSGTATRRHATQSSRQRHVASHHDITLAVYWFGKQYYLFHSFIMLGV